MSSVHPRLLLSAYYDGEVTAAEKRQVEQHLATCPECRQILDDYARIGGGVRELSRPTPPMSLHRNVWADIGRRQSSSGMGQAISGVLRLGAIAAVVLLLAFGLWRAVRPEPTGLLTAQLIDPKPTTQGVPTDASLTIEFSKPMPHSSELVDINGKLIRIEPDDPSWKVKWNNDHTLIVTPDTPWLLGTTYKVTLLEGATSSDGSKVTGDQSWEFTTVQPAQPTSTPTYTPSATPTPLPPTPTVTQPAPVIVPSETPLPAPTDTPEATATPLPEQPTATATPQLPTVTTRPTNTPQPPTATPTRLPATATHVPTRTAQPTAEVPLTVLPTEQPEKTATVEPTETEAPSTNTPQLTATVPPTVTRTVTRTATATRTHTATATSTPEITATATLTSTNTPEPTATTTPTPSPTETPGLLTTPTAVTETPTPKPLLDPTPTTYTACGIEMRSGFGMVYQADKAIAEKLGCPLDVEFGPQAAEENFQKGYMFWRADTKRIYALYNDRKEWAMFEDTWQEGDPANGNLTPPSGNLYEPVRGFGKIWREQPGVRDRLGWALDLEQLVPAAWQDFKGGMMLWTADKAIRVLFNDGTWLQFQDAP